MFIKKSTVIVFVLALLCNCAQIINAQAPDAVKVTFKSMYPNEDDPDWHKDANGNFEANFKKKGIKFRADYAPNGNWIETETSIKKKDLPKTILEIIESEFDDEKITEIEKVEHHSKGVFYDVEFKRKGKNKDVEFNEAGKIIN